MRKFVVAAVLALAILPGCSTVDKMLGRDEPPGTVEVKPRDVTPQRIVDTYTAVTATAELAAIAFKAGTIKAPQARKIQSLAKIALAAVDKSMDEWVAGNRDKAAAALSAALTAAEAARVEAAAQTKGGT